MTSSIESGDGMLILRKAMAHIETRDMGREADYLGPGYRGQPPKRDKTRYLLTMRELFDVSEILIAAYLRVKATRADLELVRAR